MARGLSRQTFPSAPPAQPVLPSRRPESGRLPGPRWANRSGMARSGCMAGRPRRRWAPRRRRPRAETAGAPEGHRTAARRQRDPRARKRRRPAAKGRRGGAPSAAHHRARGHPRSSPGQRRRWLPPVVAPQPPTLAPRRPPRESPEAAQGSGADERLVADLRDGVVLRDEARTARVSAVGVADEGHAGALAREVLRARDGERRLSRASQRGAADGHDAHSSRQRQRAGEVHEPGVERPCPGSREASGDRPAEGSSLESLRKCQHGGRR